MARQYSGTLGKTGTCQIGVSVQRTTDAASLAANWRLFCPKSWDDRGSHRPADSTARGMHGYHADHDETAGIFYTLGAATTPATKVLDPAGAHDEFGQALGVRR